VHAQELFVCLVEFVDEIEMVRVLTQPEIKVGEGFVLEDGSENFRFCHIRFLIYEVS
jgi:hypothetical protein